jgi:hypothetical protein
MSTIDRAPVEQAGESDHVSAVRGWGTTAAERAAPYPCDRVLPDAVKAMHRGVDVDAPPEVVFRWLCQLRVAPYSYDALDNLGRRSPRKLTPGLEQLELGQQFMMIYELAEFEPDRQITVRCARFTGAFGQQAVTYQVTPREGGGSRLVAKRRLKPPRAPHGLMIKTNLPVIDLIMTRKQLRTLKRLAEMQAAGAGRAAGSAEAAGTTGAGA